MEITLNEKADYLIVEIKGSLQLGNLSQLDKKMQEILRLNKHIIFNLKDVDYIDSSTIGAFVLYSDKLNKILKKFCLSEINSEINKIISITRLNKKLEIYQHIEDAIASI